MRYFVLPPILIGLLAVLAPSDGPAPLSSPIAPEILQLRAQLSPEHPEWTAAYVIERCAEHLATVNKEDRYRIRYFDLSSVPRELLPAGAATLMFGCNSLARAPITNPPRPVPNTDSRIFWVDIGWYYWTPEVWDNIAGEDPYFREPIIPTLTPGLKFLRTETASNPVLRADWFLWYAFDNGEFINAPGVENFNEKAFHYQLIYAQVEFEREENGKKVKVRGVGPKNAKEFQQAWKVDFNVLKDFPIDKGAAVDTGFSGVAHNNRVLWRVRTPIGIYWRTFDVFRTSGDQDFVETPFPLKIDAGEHIVQDERGAQFYFLTNGKDEAQDFANPFVVKGDPLGANNSVLVTARSCIHCHDTGILPFRNEHLKLAEAEVKLKAISPERAERFRQFYLQSAKMNQLVHNDQVNYREFVRDCNGLTAEENSAQFSRFRSWYIKPVGLTQAARELGCQAAELSDAIGFQGTKGRLGNLVLTGQPIPRHVWERGIYQEAGLLLLEWRKQPKIN